MITKLKCNICNREHSAIPAEGISHNSLEVRRKATLCPNGHLNNSSFLVDPAKDLFKPSKQLTYGTVGPTVDADYANFIAACISAGVTLNTTQSDAIGILITSLKAKYIWDKCLAIYPMVGASAATHKFNLKNPIDTDGAFRLLFTGSPTHSLNGVAWNGTTQYADSRISPLTNLELNNAHISYYSRTNSGGADSEIGVYNTPLTSGIYLNINYSGTEYKAVHSAETAGATGLTTNSSGLFIASRHTATDEYHKRSSASNTTATKVSTVNGQLANTIYLGAVNNETNTATSFTDRECAFASIGFGLSLLQMDAIQAIVQTYQTSLSRNV